MKSPLYLLAKEKHMILGCLFNPEPKDISEKRHQGHVGGLVS